MPEGSKKNEAPAEGFPEEKSGISRREFLKWGAALAAAIAGADAEAAADIVEKAVGTKTERRGAPKIKFDFLFGYHETAEDAKGLEEKMQEADIFIPEVAFWEVEDAVTINDIVAGRRTPEEIFKEAGLDPQEAANSFEGRRLEIMSKFRKRALLLETPPNHPLRERIQAAMADLRRPISFDIDFSKIIEDLKKRIENFASVQREREAFILDALYRLKRDLEEGKFHDPKLRGKKEIKIAMFFGAQHTWLHHRIKGWGEDSSMEFRAMPYIFGHRSEMVRRYLFGKEVDYTLAARALLESFIPVLFYSQVDKVPRDNYALAVIMRKVVSKFTFKDIEDCFTAAKESPEPMRSFYSLLEQKFRQKDIKIPKSDEELAELVRKVYPKDAEEK